MFIYPKRGYFKPTDRGQKVLGQNPPRIELGFLKQYPEFVEFHSPKKLAINTQLTNSNSAEAYSETPEEALAVGYLNLRKQIEADLLARVKACAPEFFERLVVTLFDDHGLRRLTG